MTKGTNQKSNSSTVKKDQTILCQKYKKLRRMTTTAIKKANHTLKRSKAIRKERVTKKTNEKR